MFCELLPGSSQWCKAARLQTKSYTYKGRPGLWWAVCEIIFSKGKSLKLNDRRSELLEVFYWSAKIWKTTEPRTTARRKAHQARNEHLEDRRHNTDVNSATQRQRSQWKSWETLWEYPNTIQFVDRIEFSDCWGSKEYQAIWTHYRVCNSTQFTLQFISDCQTARWSYPFGLIGWSHPWCSDEWPLTSMRRQGVWGRIRFV